VAFGYLGLVSLLFLSSFWGRPSLSWWRFPFWPFFRLSGAVRRCLGFFCVSSFFFVFNYWLSFPAPRFLWAQLCGETEPFLSIFFCRFSWSGFSSAFFMLFFGAPNFVQARFSFGLTRLDYFFTFPQIFVAPLLTDRLASNPMFSFSCSLFPSSRSSRFLLQVFFLLIMFLALVFCSRVRSKTAVFFFFDFFLVPRFAFLCGVWGDKSRGPFFRYQEAPADSMVFQSSPHVF